MTHDIYTTIAEVREFLSKMNSDNKNNKQKEEFALLQSAMEKADMPKVQHQVYDMMLFYLKLRQLITLI